MVKPAHTFPYADKVHEIISQVRCLLVVKNWYYVPGSAKCWDRLAAAVTYPFVYIQNSRPGPCCCVQLAFG